MRENRNNDGELMIQTTNFIYQLYHKVISFMLVCLFVFVFCFCLFFVFMLGSGFDFPVMFHVLVHLLFDATLEAFVG